MKKDPSSKYSGLACKPAMGKCRYEQRNENYKHKICSLLFTFKKETQSDWLLLEKEVNWKQMLQTFPAKLEKNTITRHRILNITALVLSGCCCSKTDLASLLKASSFASIFEGAHSPRGSSSVFLLVFKMLTLSLTSLSGEALTSCSLNPSSYVKKSISSCRTFKFLRLK